MNHRFPRFHLVALMAVLAGACAGCGSSPPGRASGGGGPGLDAGGTDAGAGAATTVGASGPDSGAGGTGGGPGGGGGEGADAGAGAGNEGGTPSLTYPAFTPDVGQIVNNGGDVMKRPVIVPVTWNADANQATFDAYADAFGSTGCWSAATQEYGIGAATSGSANHAHVATAAPASVQDSDLKKLITTNAGAAGGWPAATEDTIYTFFLPPGLSLLEQNFVTGQLQDDCQQRIGGYHDQVTVGTVTATYAVVPSCDFGKGNTPEQWTTMSMAHEIIEAATNPHPGDAAGGYIGFDTDHFAWDYFQELQSEVGDACEFYKSAFFEDKESTPPFNAWVQRTWSNASIKAAHDPCVPAPSGEPYFSVTPLALETVAYTVPTALTGATTATVGKTRGIFAPSGTKATFAVGFYSDGPTSGPWTISVAPGNPAISANASFIGSYNPATLTASVDRTSGQNGDTANVTVDVTSSGTGFEGEIVTITSTLNGVSHYTPVWIGSSK